MNHSRTKIISDIDAGSNVLSVRRPFKLYAEQKRRYIRLEISEPIQMSILKDDADGFWPDGSGPHYSGSILNLSAGGVLVITVNPLREGMVGLLKMSLQGIEILDNIIGIVKRVEADAAESLVGIEFISKEYLKDIFSHSEIEILSDEIISFDERIKKTLDKYVFYKRVTNE